MSLIIGKIYRLRFPGIAARVIKSDSNSRDYPYLVESFFLKSRWWVNDKGEPNNHCSPQMIVPSHSKEG